MLELVRQWLINTLGFSKSEANGTLILIFLILTIAILPKIYIHNTFAGQDGFIYENENLEEWAKELESSLVKNERQKEVRGINEKKIVRTFPFDPNTASRTQLIELGFSERAVKNLINYRAKGGRFRIKSDLKKVYGISQQQVDALWGQIKLPASFPEVNEAQSIKREIPEEKTVKLDLNAVNAADLQKIRGIGVKLSARIIKFRDGLGGFHSPDQIEEVYGLSPDVIKSLKEISTVSGAVKKLKINTDSAHHLYKHPYIGYNIANAIVNYRNQHGNFDSIPQIKGIKIISDSLYKKIYPYISLNP